MFRQFYMCANTILPRKIFESVIYSCLKEYIVHYKLIETIFNKKKTYFQYTNTPQYSTIIILIVVCISQHIHLKYCFNYSVLKFKKSGNFLDLRLCSCFEKYIRNINTMFSMFRMFSCTTSMFGGTGTRYLFILGEI